MSEIDRLKEQLTYLRFWLGIGVVTAITLIGWLISTWASADPTLWFAGLIGVGVLFVAVYLVHRQIERRIEQIGKL